MRVRPGEEGGLRGVYAGLLMQGDGYVNVRSRYTRKQGVKPAACTDSIKPSLKKVGSGKARE